jgi:hypothetical protein
MRKNIFKIRKASAFTIVAIFILLSIAPTIASKNNTTNNDKPIDIIRNNQRLISTEEMEQKQINLIRNLDLERGWYWKPSYPNYSPNGMPDFDEKQDQWKAIEPGPDGIIQSQPVGDDIFNPTENCIAPGPDCSLQTVPAGDDTVVWAFCGPVALANCFWWFDSKYADSTGTPGDGKDNFTLVSDYGAGDDHSAANVPLLIKNLAVAMQTTSKGTTYIEDMQNAIHQWFIDTGLVNDFTETTYNKPTFQFVESEIERSQDVILLIGYYNKAKIVDQQQTQWNQVVDLPHMTGHLQSFTPSVNVLDAVQVLLSGNYPTPTTVKVSIWNQLPAPGLTPLGTSQMTIIPLGPTWYQFHFDPSISLTPGALYYISVDELTTIYNIHWHYYNQDVYPGGIAFWEGPPWVFTPQPDKDFAFKTEYYGDECYRIGGHYLTCAGVNSQDLKIGVSDPCWDIQSPTPDYTKHNDPQFVSHDVYDVLNGSPCSNLDYKWWLPDFPSDCEYTIVEQAVVICPVNNPPNKPVKPSGQANGKINVEYTYTSNTTDSDDDQVSYLFDWGDGTNSSWIGPYASGATASIKHKWTVKGTYIIKVKAKDSYGAESSWSDPLTITMPKSSAFFFDFPIIQVLKQLFQRFPHAFPFLQYLLG